MRCRVLLAALLALIICSSSSASVTINGKTLDQIDDIIAFTTNSHIEEKFSLLKFMKDKGGAYHYYPVYGKVDGSNVTLTQGKVHESDAVAHQAGKTNTGVYPVLGKEKTSDGKLVVMFPAAQTSNKLFINSIKISGSNPDYSLTDEGYWYRTIEEKENLYVNDSTSGLLPDGNEGHEIFAVSYFIAKGGKRPGYNQDYEAYIALVDPEGQTWKHHKISNMSGHFPSIRITAGDFDNDGIANELALIRNSTGNDYYMQVFRVDARLNISEIYNSKGIGGRNDDGDNIDGCDITAGDFNGDFKNEIAVVYANKISHDGYPSIIIFSWNGSTFTQKSDSNEDDGVRLGSTYWTRSSYVPHFGIITEAGDINDDGKDELVFLTASYGSNEGNIIVSVWGTADDLQPKKYFYKKTSQKIAGYGGVAGVDMAECSYLPRSLSLALVPTGEKLSTGGSIRKIFISRTQGDDSVQSSSDYRTGDQTFYCTPQFNGTNLTGISDITLYNQGGAGRAMTLVAGDFYRETLELGEPEHIVIQGHKNYSINLKVPPYHVDYIKAPWMDSLPSNPFNFSYLGRNVQFLRTQEDSEETLVTSKMQCAVEGGIDFSYNMNAGIKIPALAEGSAKGGFSVGASLGLNLVKEEADKNIAKNSLSDKLKTTTADALMYTVADYHIWRYPVIQQGTANFEDNFEDNELLDEDNSELNGQYFITYTLCDEPSEHYCDSNSSAQYDDYNPSYEEGNLFSYPNSISFGMDYAQQLSSPKYFDLTTDTAQTLSFTNAGSSSNKLSTSWKATVTGDIHGEINASANIKVLKLGGGYSAKLYGKSSFEAANGVTSTKTWSNTEQINISANTDNLLYTIADAQYTTGSQVFVDAAGILTTPFSVNFGSNAWLWNQNSKESVQSPYVISSDPALVLPGRYVQEKYKNEYGVVSNVWKFSKNEASATKIRGITIYDNITKQYVSGALEKGWSYTISVPIYNASFVDVPGDGVVVEYGYQNEDGSGRTQLGRQTIALKGWSNNTDTGKGGSNKGTLEFDWTPDIAEDDYEFYFVLDPDNLISEIHESWSHDTRDGNNNGYYPFSIIKTPEVNATAFISEEDDELTSRDFTLRFWDIENQTGNGMTAQELREYVLAEDKDVHVKGRVTYSGSQVLTNIEVLTLCHSLSDDVIHVVSHRRIPAIRPGKVREFYFTITPEILSGSRFSVDFSSSNGNITVNGGEGAIDDDDGNNNDDNESINLGNSGSGCNMGFAGVLSALLAGLFVISSKKF